MTMAKTASYNFNEIIALAWAHSNQGREYVGTGREEASTAQRVRASLEYTTGEDPDYYHRKSLEAAAYQCDSALMQAIAGAGQKVTGNTAYINGLRRALTRSADGQVADTDLNMVVSLVWLYMSQIEKEEFERLLPVTLTQGFLGAVGETLKVLPVTIHTVHYWDDRYGSPRTLLTGVSDSGHTIVWSASRMIDVIPRQRVVFARATIKALQRYRETDQTVLTKAHLVKGYEGGYRQ